MWFSVSGCLVTATPDHHDAQRHAGSGGGRGYHSPLIPSDEPEENLTGINLIAELPLQLHDLAKTLTVIGLVVFWLVFFPSLLIYFKNLTFVS